MSIDTKRIFLKLERLNESEVKLEFDFNRDEENYTYVMGIASTPDVNSAGFIVENQALLECWKRVKSEGKNIAVYEKHDYPIGKVVACDEINNKILVAMEIPKAGNERFLSVYNQGIYVGLSIGGWSLDGTWGEDDIYRVTEFDWYEVSLTDIPANENALLLEYANSIKPQPQVELEEEKEEEIELEKEEICDKDLMALTENIVNNIRGI